MARRPSAPEWLTRQFWEATVFKGVGGRQVPAGCFFFGLAGDGRECEGDIQAAHFIAKADVKSWLEAQIWVCENCVDGILYGTLEADPTEGLVPYVCPACVGNGMSRIQRDELIVLAMYDPRNAVPACADEHHTRFDNTRVPESAPELKVPRARVPARVLEFVEDYGLEHRLERKTA